jgi:choline kinase
MKAVIIAAGQSSRLWPQTDKTPKTLLPFKKNTILGTVIKRLKKSGVNKIFLVVGYKDNLIRTHIKENPPTDVKIKLIVNPEWQKGNGLSVLCAEKYVGKKPFILSMCDHVVSVKAIKRVVQHEHKKDNLLLVDRRIDDIFDIDDATKVLVRKKKIVNIDKNLTIYNGIDCGIFRLDYRFFKAMKKRHKNEGLESISAGVGGLIKKGRMRAVYMKNNEKWIDIDTPEAYKFARTKF